MSTAAASATADMVAITPIAVADITPMAAIGTVVTGTMQVSTTNMATMPVTIATMLVTAITATTPPTLTGITVADAAGCIATL